MNLILLENIENVGFKDEIVSVKSGFGRNFLIPRGKAVLATETSVKQLNEKLKQQERKEEELITAAKKIAEELKNIELKIKAKVAEDKKKIFGSINSSHFIENLSTLGYDIDKRFVKLGMIKELGKYEAEVRLHRNLSVTIPFEVIKE
ncbi:MAG: 50S ribosomal protein L9 [Bacteroidota bacterium]|nr:50S ribosomal protein L9 [Bacteroidota bacterium]